MKYKLFTTPSCTSCPSVKSFVSELKLSVELIDASTEDGRAEAMKYSIRSVPTILFFNDDNVDTPVATAHSINKIQELLNKYSE